MERLRVSPKYGWRFAWEVDRSQCNLNMSPSHFNGMATYFNYITIDVYGLFYMSIHVCAIRLLNIHLPYVKHHHYDCTCHCLQRGVRAKWRLWGSINWMECVSLNLQPVIVWYLLHIQFYHCEMKPPSFINGNNRLWRIHISLDS